MTPYYSEETVYSKNDLEVENEDGVSIIYYLQKIYPGLYKKTIYDLTVFCFYKNDWAKLTVILLDEWNNFMERIECKKDSEVWERDDNILQLRHWASLRGQTLCRTGNDGFSFFNSVEGFGQLIIFLPSSPVEGFGQLIIFLPYL